MALQTLINKSSSDEWKVLKCVSEVSACLTSERPQQSNLNTENRLNLPFLDSQWSSVGQSCSLWLFSGKAITRSMITCITWFL